MAEPRKANIEYARQACDYLQVASYSGALYIYHELLNDPHLDNWVLAQVAEHDRYFLLTTVLRVASQVPRVYHPSLARGRYYLGLCSDTSDVSQKLQAMIPAAGICQSFGLLEDTSCAPPMTTNANPATFAAYTRTFIPLVGVQGYRTLGP